MRNLRERVRAKWADLVFNFAESLPTFNAGVVALFQETRKWQRQSSKDDFDRSRLPESAQVKLHSFTLLQLYLLEDLEMLNTSLGRLFPKTALDRGRELIGDSDSLMGLSWSYVGHIVEKRKSFFPFPGELAILNDLPSEIEHISVEIHRVLPSLLALCFGVTLGEPVSTKLQKLYEDAYLGEIKFNSWFPFSLRRWGTSEGSPERARELAIHDFVDSVRADAERFLARHVPGPTHLAAPFLAIDEFHLASGNATAVDVSGMASWGRQFGFGPWNYHSFRLDKFAAFLAEGKSVELDYPPRLIVIGDPQQGDIANSRIANTTHELVPFLVIHRILSDSEDIVGKLRLQVFRRMANRGLTGWFWRRLSASFLRDIRLNSDLQVSRMLLTRLSLEYEQHSSVLGTWCSGLKGFVHVNKPDTTLLDFFQTVVTREFDLVSKHLQLAAESFSAHLSARNIDVT